MIQGGLLTSLYCNRKDTVSYLYSATFTRVFCKVFIICVVVFVSNKFHDFHDWVQSEKGEVNFRGVLKREGVVERLVSTELVEVGLSHPTPSLYSIKRNE